MAKGYYRDIRNLLKEHGFTYEGNAKGSHEKWYDSLNDKTVTIPYNLKSRHTANGILKSAGIDQKF